MSVSFQKKLHQPSSPTEPLQCELQEIKPLRELDDYDNEVLKTNGQQSRCDKENNLENILENDDDLDVIPEAQIIIIPPSI